MTKWTNEEVIQKNILDDGLGILLRSLWRMFSIFGSVLSVFSPWRLDRAWLLAFDVAWSTLIRIPAAANYLTLASCFNRLLLHTSTTTITTIQFINAYKRICQCKINLFHKNPIIKSMRVCLIVTILCHFLVTDGKSWLREGSFGKKSCEFSQLGGGSS